jgi:hypothetical protein
MVESLRNLTPYLFFTVIASVAIETFLSARWMPFYYKSGISVYRRKIIVQAGFSQEPTAEKIEAGLPDNGWFAPMLVRRLDDNTFAFREKMLSFRFGAYSPVMRGCIICKPHAGHVEIHGYANWFIVALSLYILVFFIAPPIDVVDLLVPLFFTGILLSIYWIQKRRFRSVEEVFMKLQSGSKTEGTNG